MKMQTRVRIDLGDLRFGAPENVIEAALAVVRAHNRAKRKLADRRLAQRCVNAGLQPPPKKGVVIATGQGGRVYGWARVSDRKAVAALGGTTLTYRQ